VVRAAAVELDDAVAAALLAPETRISGGSQPAVPNLLYRALVAAIKRLSSEPLNGEAQGHEVRALAVQNN